MNKRILLISESSQFSCHCVEELIQNGCRVIIADKLSPVKNYLSKETPLAIIYALPLLDNDYPLLKEIRDCVRLSNIPVICIAQNNFISTFRQCMNLGADDCLDAGASYSELLECIESRIKRYNIINKKNYTGHSPGEPVHTPRENRLFLTSKGTLQILHLDDIMFIKAQNEYSTLFLKNNSKYMMRRSLYKWLEILPESNFIRIHRSTIINLDFVETIKKYSKSNYIVKLKDVEELMYISKRFSIKFKTLFH